MDSYRPTWAEIDLKAISANYKYIKKLVLGDTKVMAVVKANAYGHGSLNVAKVLENEQVDYLGVATIDEAMFLRENGIVSKILVLGPVFEHELETAAESDITITVCNNEILQHIEKYRLKIKIHIEVDTGMGRIGIWHEDAVAFVKKAFTCRGDIDIEGIYTHFSVAGRDKFFTRYQITAFSKVIAELEANGIQIPLKHAANSIGLIIYGMYPKRNFTKIMKLRPAFTLKTKIAFLKNVSEGRSISYGRTFITQNPTIIATLPIGYADGYGRILSSKAKVLVKGQLAPVVGKVTMDQTMIDVGHIHDVKLGDEVVLIGRQNLKEITMEDLSRLAGTIPYEVVTGITSRVPRTYLH